MPSPLLPIALLLARTAAGVWLTNEVANLLFRPVGPTNEKVPRPQPTPTKPPNNVTNNYNTRNNTYNFTRITETNIYNTVNVNITIPQLPTRNLPQQLTGGGSSNTQFTYTSKVKKSLANRRWGKLITRPFYNQPETICLGSNLTPTDFFDTIQQDVNSLQPPTLPDGQLPDALFNAIAFLSVGDIGLPVPIPTLEIITRISSYYGAMAQITGFEVTGLINLGEILIEDCGYIPDAHQYPRMLTDEQDGFIECAQPLVMFPDRTGYKPPQLQITWRNSDWAPDNRYPKVTTFPHPKDPATLTADSIKGALPSSFTFGKLMFKFNFVYGGKVNEGGESGNLKAFGESIVFADSDDFPNIYRGWVNGLCDSTLISLNENRPFTKIDYGNNSLEIHTGSYYPYRAVYMEWDRDRKKWRPLYQWRLKQ
jgi:hypothetical protein